MSHDVHTVAADDLVEGVRAAAPDALESVYRTYAGPLMSWVLSQGVHLSVAEEVVVQTFLDLVRHSRSVTGSDRGLQSWLYQTARRNLGDQHPWGVPAGPHGAAEPLPADPDADRVIARSSRSMIAEAMQRLSEEERETVALRYLSDLTVAEIADITGRSRATVRELLVTGRKVLATHLLAQSSPSTGEAS